MVTSFIFLLVGVILILVAAIVYSQYMAVKPDPPRWPYFFLILGIILIIVGTILLFFPPPSELPVIVDPVAVKVTSN